MILKKKGSAKVVTGLLLAVIVFLILSFFLGGGTKTFAKTITKDCVADLGGRCSTLFLQCLPGEQVSIIPAVCDKEGKQTCCTRIAETNPDEFCKGKKPGDQCGTPAEYKVCNDALQCTITKCEFCDAKPTDPNCNNVFNDANKKINFEPDFSCGCTLAQCNPKLNDGSCVKKFCPGATYCCVK